MQNVFPKKKKNGIENIEGGSADAAVVVEKEIPFKFNFFNDEATKKKRKKKKKKKGGSVIADQSDQINKEVDSESDDELETALNQNQDKSANIVTIEAIPTEIDKIAILSHKLEDMALSASETHDKNHESDGVSSDEEVAITNNDSSEKATTSSKKKKKKKKKKSAKVSTENELNLEQPPKEQTSNTSTTNKSPQKAKTSAKSAQPSTTNNNNINANLDYITRFLSGQPLNLPSSAPPAHHINRNASGPHFMSPNDPELDQKSRLFAKYGKGKNLVAIGPPKVRDPNWLSNTDSNQKRESVNNSTNSSANDTNTVLHSSPFSFSFSGL